MFGFKFKKNRQNKVYPLSSLQSSVLVAYGVRKLLPTYTGPLVTGRRSTDNATMDFYPAGDGWLHVATLMAWAGSASVYVTRWWDQSGRGYHADQPTASAQPMLVNTGSLVMIGLYPAVESGAGKYFQANTPIIPQPFSIAATIQAGDYSIGSYQNIVRANTGGAYFSVNGASQVLLNCDAFLIAQTIPVDGTKYFLSCVGSRENSIIGVNSIFKSGDAGSGSISASTAFLGSSVASRYLQGKAGELVIFNSALSTETLSSVGASFGTPRGITV